LGRERGEKKKKSLWYKRGIRAIESEKKFQNPRTPDNGCKKEKRLVKKRSGRTEEKISRDAAYPRKCSGGGFGEATAERILHCEKRCVMDSNKGIGLVESGILCTYSI